MEITLRHILQFPLFKPFEDSPHKLRNILDHAEILRYNQGDVIINEGDDDGGALYLICEGAVVIAKIIDPTTGRAKPLAVLRKANYFGEMSLFDQQPRSASVIAQTETHLLKISSNSFQNLVRTDVEISSELLSQIIRGVSERLRRTNMELVVLYDTGKFIAQIENFADMSNALLNRLSESLMADSGALLVYNELSYAFDLVATTGNREVFNEEFNTLIMSHLKSLGKGFISPGTDDTLNIQSLIQQLSLLAVPLIHHNTIYGAFILLRESNPSGGCSFKDADFNLAIGVAQQAGSAVENVRLRDEEKARMAHSRRRR